MVKDGSERLTPAEARRKRLAASLRSNLRRRKDQGRDRADEPGEKMTGQPADGQPPENDPVRKR